MKAAVVATAGGAVPEYQDFPEPEATRTVRAGRAG